MSNILQVGAKAPGFTLNNQDGKAVRLADYEGKWRVVYFYPKDNTSGCTQEAVDFSALLPEFEKEGAVVFGVSPDSEKSHARFAEKHGLKVELLSDPEHTVMAQYGVWQLKKMYGKEYMGVVRSTFLITPEGVIAKSWGKVKVKNHAREVQTALCELKG